MYISAQRFRGVYNLGNTAQGYSVYIKPSGKQAARVDSLQNAELVLLGYTDIEHPAVTGQPTGAYGYFSNKQDGGLYLVQNDEHGQDGTQFDATQTLPPNLTDGILKNLMTKAQQAKLTVITRGKKAKEQVQYLLELNKR